MLAAHSAAELAAHAAEAARVSRALRYWQQVGDPSHLQSFELNQQEVVIRALCLYRYQADRSFRFVRGLIKEYIVYP